MVGTDPGFIRLSVPFTWTARVKQSVSKCSEHIPNVPVGLKSFWCCFSSIFVRMLPLDGEVCIEMPNPYRRFGCRIALHSVLEAF